MKNKQEIKNTGYSIIEVMVSVTIFLVVVVFGIGSLLNAYSIYNKTQNIRSIMDNLNFILDDMSRNIRVGYNYRCGSGQDCEAGSKLLFESAEGDTANTGDDWGYRIVSLGENYVIERTVSGDSLDSWEQVSDPSISMDSTIYPFSVLGSCPESGGLCNDTQQPMVTIRLVGSITDNKGEVTDFSLQTTVAQRSIDINL